MDGSMEVIIFSAVDGGMDKWKSFKYLLQYHRFFLNNNKSNNNNKFGDNHDFDL